VSAIVPRTLPGLKPFPESPLSFCGKDAIMSLGFHKIPSGGASMDEKQEQKFHQLTEEPVGRLISLLAVPCIISMLVTAFYNMADTFFVGMLRSNAATGAVGVVFSMMAVIQAIGFFFGHGSGNFISRELGKHHMEEASNMAATGFFTALFTGLAICILGEIFLTPLATLLGSSDRQSTRLN